MGIPSLLRLLKPFEQRIHISAFAGKQVGVDAFCWLHRACYSCSMELALGQPTDKYVRFCINRVRLLRSYNVEPILVFDGCSLPAKGKTDEQRRKLRKEHLRLGMEALQTGNGSLAKDHFDKSTEITTTMTRKVQDALRSEACKFIVAPYEADAQLAFLFKQGKVAAVITEDSDLLVHGVDNVLFKMDKDGNGVLLSKERIFKANVSSPVSFRTFSEEDFLNMSVLMGCDYLDGITGIGGATAHRLVSESRTMDRVFQRLRFDPKYKLPTGYEEAFEKAKLVFRHQTVFDSDKGSVRPLTLPLPEHLASMTHGTANNADSFLTSEVIATDDRARNPTVTVDGDSRSPVAFLGEHLDDETARLVASGAIDPKTRQPFELAEEIKAAPLEPLVPAPAMPLRSRALKTSHRRLLQEKASSIEVQRGSLRSIENFFRSTTEKSTTSTLFASRKAAGELTETLSDAVDNRSLTDFLAERKEQLHKGSLSDSAVDGAPEHEGGAVLSRFFRLPTLSSSSSQAKGDELSRTAEATEVKGMDKIESRADAPSVTENEVQVHEQGDAGLEENTVPRAEQVTRPIEFYENETQVEETTTEVSVLSCNTQGEGVLASNSQRRETKLLLDKFRFKSPDEASQTWPKKRRRSVGLSRPSKKAFDSPFFGKTLKDSAVLQQTKQATAGEGSPLRRFRYARK